MTTREANFTFVALQEHYREPHPLYDALLARSPARFRQAHASRKV